VALEEEDLDAARRIPGEEDRRSFAGDDRRRVRGPR
jgi:hypothetical protein